MSTETTRGPAADTPEPDRGRNGSVTTAPAHPGTNGTNGYGGNGNGANGTATRGGTTTVEPATTPGPVPAPEPGDVRRATATPTATPGRPPAPPAPVGSSTPWAISLIVLVTGMFMSVLDVSIVNVAIPAMQKEFGASTDDIQWVATAYSLALGVIVPASAWLGERLGLARAYILSLVFFGAGSALCGLAWDLNSMIVFRILQAIPGGIIPVVALSMLYRIVPRAKIGAAMGMYGLGIVVAPAVGPTLGGYLVEYVDWRLIFFINVPIGVIGAIAAIILLPKFSGARAHRFDFPGFITIATGLFSLLLALSKGQDWGWTAYSTLGLIVLGVLSLALFVVIELEVEHPMLDVRVFRYWPFTNSLILIAILSVGLFGVLFYIPLYLQQYQNLGAFDSGLLLLPQALVMAVLMPIAGRIYDRFGARWPAVIGMTIMAIGTYLLHDLSIDTPHTQLQLILAFRASGMGLAMMPIMTNGLSSVPPDKTSGASAFNNVAQRTSAAIGLAAMTAVMTAQQAQIESDKGSLMGSLRSSMNSMRTSANSGLSGTASTSPPPMHGSTGWVLQQYGMVSNAQGQVFVSAMNDVMLIVSIMTAGAILLALMLRKPAASGADVGPVEV